MPGRRSGVMVLTAERLLRPSRPALSYITATQLPLMPVFQLTYTTLFGWFAAYSFLRTGKSLNTSSGQTTESEQARTPSRGLYSVPSVISTILFHSDPQ